MIGPDPKVVARLAPFIERVLVADPNLASNTLLVDILKQLGARRCRHAPDTERALEICAELQPQLIFAEYAGPLMDGVELTWRLRRSALPARKAPVILVSGDTRESAIRLARDAGAHEFLGKPFAALGVFRRVENVALKRRPWVETKAYVGPDRRRFNSADYEGAKRREEDVLAAEAEAERTFEGVQLDILLQAELLAAAPQTAIKVMIERTYDLERTNLGPDSHRVGEEIRSLQRYLVSVIDQAEIDVDRVLSQLDAIRRLREGRSRPTRRRSRAA